MKTKSKSQSLLSVKGNGGFALVVTLMLMILLMIITLSMLGLSSVTLRSSSYESAKLQARANARMALMIAIGELQKYAGTDRAITATSDLYSTSTTPVAKSNTTGVWESWWDFNPNDSPDYDAEKTNRFRKWLVSSANSSDLESLDFVNNPWSGDSIELVGKGTLGDGVSNSQKISAGLVPITRNGKINGAYAWHVSDESVKTRINNYRDPGQNKTLAQRRALLAGHRADPSVIRDTNGNLIDFLPNDSNAAEYANAMMTTAKVIDLDQAELLQGAAGRIKKMRHHMTPYSLGVLSNVCGGLKQDLSSVFEMGAENTNALPTEFAGKKLYESTHGITGKSDPYWSALAGYYNSFRNLSNPETDPTVGVKLDPADLPTVPTGYNLTPVITKVDTIFSLIGRPIKDVNWMYRGNPPSPIGRDYDYMVNLIFTPMVTLHNPYNVSLSFHSMNVEFVNIPVAFNFMFQDSGIGPFVSKCFVPGVFESLNNMNYAQNRTNKRFVMRIADWSNDKHARNTSANTFATNGPIVMKPGQTMVFSPYFSAKSTISSDPASFYEDSRNIIGHNGVAFDWANHMTGSIKAKNIFVPGVGFETCLITPSSQINGHSWNHHLLLRDGRSPYNSGHVTDRFYVEFKIQQPSWYPNLPPDMTRVLAPPSFEISAEIKADAASEPVKYTSLKFDYADEPNSKNISNLYENRVYRYPPSPNDSLTGFEIAAPHRQPYATQAAYVHPLAIFSAYARTTNGGVNETGKRKKISLTGNSSEINIYKDGRLAGKPFLFHNMTRANFTMDLTKEKPASQAYEINFQPFLSKGDFQDYMDVDAANRVPALTGNKSTSGIKSGSYLEIPSGPLQTIADFRRSNALHTSYLPHFVQPVGNSMLHPMMSPNKVVEIDPSISSTALLDHSVLANHALYDRFYFSTISTRGSETPDVVFEKFMDGTAPLPNQSFEPYRFSNVSLDETKSKLFANGKPKDESYKSVAQYQMIRGPFNVNSTSVQAWKAVLSSMKKSDVTALWSKNKKLESISTTGIPITSMSMPNGGSISKTKINPAKIDNSRTNSWNGFPEFYEEQVETLAEKMVDEVRERGPFLSMSEFLNRRIGPLGPHSLRGALEAAIAKSGINEPIDAKSGNSFLNQVPITTEDVSDPDLYSYKTPEATIGNPIAGAPGWINQGDLMRILEPCATVRGDTFVIRTYGESKDKNGNVIARAYAEAVVQRFPEYVDTSDAPYVNVWTDPSAKAANKRFGRRFKVIAFRWLTDNEI